MLYRIRTYVAGDWSDHADLIHKLTEWDSCGDLALLYSNAHLMTKVMDVKLPCSVKHSLAEKLDDSKTFVLIVNGDVDIFRKGGCQYCQSYNRYTYSCARGYSVDQRSFVEFECEKAVRDDLKIVVIYNSSYVDNHNCPECIRYKGKHIPARTPYIHSWDYEAIKNAILY